MNREAAKARQKLQKQLLLFAVSSILTVLLIGVTAYAAPGISIDLTPDAGTGEAMGVLDVMFLFAVLTLFPTILLMMTSFTRLIIVLSFLRNAMGTQQSPPNQVMIGIALFLTLYIMTPVVTEIQTQAYVPYKAGEMTSMEAVNAGVKPLKRFMLEQTAPKALTLFLSISGSEIPVVEEGQDSIEVLSNKLGLEIVVPAFITSELERAMLMGFLIFVPFLIIDMVVASVLMSMGMMMLPPAMISLPFKMLMFILVDGWSLTLGTLVQSFE